MDYFNAALEKTQIVAQQQQQQQREPEQRQHQQCWAIENAPMELCLDDPSATVTIINLAHHIGPATNDIESIHKAQTAFRTYKLTNPNNRRSPDLYRKMFLPSIYNQNNEPYRRTVIIPLIIKVFGMYDGTELYASGWEKQQNKIIFKCCRGRLYKKKKQHKKETTSSNNNAKDDKDDINIITIKRRRRNTTTAKPTCIADQCNVKMALYWEPVLERWYFYENGPGCRFHTSHGRHVKSQYNKASRISDFITDTTTTTTIPATAAAPPTQAPAVAAAPAEPAPTRAPAAKQCVQVARAKDSSSLPTPTTTATGDNNNNRDDCLQPLEDTTGGATTTTTAAAAELETAVAASVAHGNNDDMNNNNSSNNNHNNDDYCQRMRMIITNGSNHDEDDDNDNDHDNNFTNYLSKRRVFIETARKELDNNTASSSKSDAMLALLKPRIERICQLVATAANNDDEHQPHNDNDDLPLVYLKLQQTLDRIERQYTTNRTKRKRS